MNIQEILRNPDLISNLSSQEKTQVYMQLNNLKADINNKLVEYKTKKELLEKQRQELQDDLYKTAGVSDDESLIAYVSNLQKEFNKALEEQTIELSNVMNKLNI